MAENPAIWGPATKIIDEAIEEAHIAASAGYVGFSLAAKIARALQHAGFLNEEDVWDEKGIGFTAAAKVAKELQAAGLLNEKGYID